MLPQLSGEYLLLHFWTNTHIPSLVYNLYSRPIHGIPQVINRPAIVVTPPHAQTL